MELASEFPAIVLYPGFREGEVSEVAQSGRCSDTRIAIAPTEDPEAEYQGWHPGTRRGGRSGFREPWLPWDDLVPGLRERVAGFR